MTLLSPYRTSRCYGVSLCEEMWILLSPQRWMKSLTQQGALLELQAWLEAAESRLKEGRSRIRHSSSTCADLSRLLRDCRVKRRRHFSASFQVLFVCCVSDCLRPSVSGPSDGDVRPSGHSGLREPAFRATQHRGRPQGAL